MLRLIAPADTAVPVPWRVDRTDRRHPVVTYVGHPAADAVRVFRRAATVQHWGRMHPGDSAAVCLCDGDPDSELITLAWFDSPTDAELLWGFVV